MSHKIITSTRFSIFTLPDRIGIIADTLHIHILPETGLHSYNTSFVLSKYFPAFCFTCDLHKEWGFKFASKIIINVFFNNKQKIINATVRKDAVIRFKSRQREK